jgi:hypothetical protein
MSELTQTHVLFDTENLFAPYGYHTPLKDSDRKILAKHFPSVPVEAALALGAATAHELVEYLDERYARIESRSFGKPTDAGVIASRVVLLDHGFRHTNVPHGKDLAELEVNKAVSAITQSGGGHITLGGRDGTMLLHAAQTRTAKKGRWSFLVVLPAKGSAQTGEFRKGEYADLDRVVIAHIKCLQAGRRKHDPVARAAYRLVVRTSLARYAERAATMPVTTFFDAIATITRVQPADNSSSDAVQTWLKEASICLASEGLDEKVSASLVAWSSLHVADVKRAPIHPSHELLFSAAVELYLRGLDADTAAKLRLLSLAEAESSRSDLLVPLERALDRLLIEHP